MSMGVDWPGLVYHPNFDYWARAITVTPVASQPGIGAYGARGIFNTGETLVPAMDGSLVSTNQTIVDILVDEFPILPAQGDLIDIPDTTVKGGAFMVANVSGDNGGGEITVTLKRREDSMLAWNLIAANYDLGSPAFATPHLHVVTSVSAASYDLGSPAFDMPPLSVS
jgi:hypothetical protein